MGPAITAVRDSVALLGRRPSIVAVLAVVGGVAAVVSAGLAFFGLFVPILPQVLVGGIVVPLTLCVVVGVVDGGADGRPLVEAVTDAVGDGSLSLIGAHTLWLTVWIVLSTGVTILLFVGGILSAVNPADPGTASALADGLGLLGFAAFGFVWLLLAVGAVFFQFFDVLVVVGGASALGAYREAWQFVVAAPLSSIGYTLARIATGAVPILATVVVAFALEAANATGLVSVVVGLGVFGVTWLVVFVLQFVYHTAYYRRRVGSPVA